MKTKFNSALIKTWEAVRLIFGVLGALLLIALAFVLVLWIWLAIVFWVLPDMCASGQYDCSTLLERKRSD